jgi:hypothetical protein
MSSEVETSLDISDLLWRQASRLQFFCLLPVRLALSTTQLLNLFGFVYAAASQLKI